VVTKRLFVFPAFLNVIPAGPVLDLIGERESIYVSLCPRRLAASCGSSLLVQSAIQAFTLTGWLIVYLDVVGEDFHIHIAYFNLIGDFFQVLAFPT